MSGYFFLIITCILGYEMLKYFPRKQKQYEYISGLYSVCWCSRLIAPSCHYFEYGRWGSVLPCEYENFCYPGSSIRGMHYWAFRVRDGRSSIHNKTSTLEWRVINFYPLSVVLRFKKGGSWNKCPFFLNSSLGFLYFNGKSFIRRLFTDVIYLFESFVVITGDFFICNWVIRFL